MADRYWVGGTGNINDTAKWSTTSGGSGGASVPTLDDNAYFDGASDTGAAFTVTLNASFSCKDFVVGDGVTVTALDQIMTLAGSSNLNIFGSLFLPTTSMSISGDRQVSFSGTTLGNTITTNGKNISGGGNCFVVSTGGEYILGSSFTVAQGGGARRFQVGTGTLIFDTNGFNVTATTIELRGNCTVKLNSSTVTASQNSFSAQWLCDSTVTLDAGTSTIQLAGSTGSSELQSFFGGGKTYYNVSFGGVDRSRTNGRGTNVISGGNTFNNLTISDSPANTIKYYSFGSNTINGTFSVQPTQTNRSGRVGIQSNDVNSQITITANAININSTDFSGVVAAGSASWNDGVDMNYCGNASNNSGIAFPTKKNVYWNLAGSQNWTSTGWALTENGTPSTNNFPFVHDDVFFTELGSVGTVTIDQPYQIGNISFDNGTSPRTSSATLNIGTDSGLRLFGNLTLSSGAFFTISGSANYFFISNFDPAAVQTIRSAGKTIPGANFSTNNTGKIQLLDNLTISTITLSRGILDLSNFVATMSSFGSQDLTTVRRIDFGSQGKIVLTGNNSSILSISNATNLTMTGSRRFEFSYTGSTGTRSYDLYRTGSAPTLSQNLFDIFVTGGSDIVTPATSNASPIRSLNFSGFSGTFNPQVTNIFGDLFISSSMTLGASSGTMSFPTGAGETRSITSNGKTFDFSITKSDAGTLRLEDNLTMGATRTFTHTSGTFNLNGRALTCQNWSSSNSNVRALIFGAGQIIVGGTGAVWEASTATNYTITPGSGKIVLSNNTNTAREFRGGGIITYPELEIGGDTGTATTTLTGANGFTKLTSTKTVAHTIVFPNAETRVANWNLNGSEGNLITLSRTGGSGTFTIRYTGASYGLGRYLSISNSTAQPVNRMYAIYSTDGGGNTNWIFDAPKFSQFINFFDIA